MAQNFRRYISRNIGTSVQSIITPTTYTTVVGINLSNTTASSVNVSAYITTGGVDYYLVKGASIPTGSALQVLDGGAKFVIQSGDVLKVVSDTATSIDAWTSTVDDISS
jgi:hypothetical protein